MDLTSLLKGFAAEARLGEVIQNAVGGCVLDMYAGARIIIEPTPDKQWVFLTGFLCAVPEENGPRHALFEALAKAHGRNAAKQAYCFAWTPVLDRVVISQRMPLQGMEQAAFNMIVMEFVHGYLHWREEVTSGRLLEALPDTDAAPRSAPRHSMLRL